MAKRIQVKGKAPRGISKYERQYNYAYRSRGGLGGGRRVGNREMMSTVKRVNRDGTVEPHWSPIADKNVMSRPSSTRKKLVKEGNRKFIGPRQFKNELAENSNVGMTSRDVSRLEAMNLMEQEGSDIENPELVAKYVRAIKNYRKATSRRRRGSTEPEYGRGTIGSKKLRNLLRNLERRNLGGGQEFDEQD